jgi:hypothetical protein
MSAGLPKYVVVNLDDLEKAFDAGSEVTLAAVADKGLLNISGRDATLGLKASARRRRRGAALAAGALRCRSACGSPGAALSRSGCFPAGSGAPIRATPLAHPFASSSSPPPPALPRRQVLGSGSISKALTVKADAFSASAAEKIGAAGGKAEAAAAKKKWTRRAHEKRVAEMVAAGLDPKKEAAKAKAERAAAKKP